MQILVQIEVKVEADESVSRKKAAEKKEAEAPEAVIVQVDDLLSFRQFSKRDADAGIDVCELSISH